ncbi:MAG TPA: YcxB family protein [Blastocatellia bacterium]|nr:YcxB family protein [Blastocatellia bacterium]
MMEVEYELTTDDLYAFQWRAALRSPIARRARRKVYAGWLLALLLFSALPAIGADGFVISRVNFTFLLVAFPVVVLAQWYLERRLTRQAILQLLNGEKAEKGQLGRHKVVLSESGVVESTAVGESRTSWAGVDRIEHNPEYIFIYTSRAAAHIIPKRAFRDMQEAEAFYQLSRMSKEAAG